MINNLNSVQSSTQNTEPYVAKVSVNQFKTFKNFLGIIRKEFNDFTVHDGVFRSYTNNQALLVESGIKYLRGMSFNITNINSKIRNISIVGKKSATTFTYRNDCIEIDDTITPLSFRCGSEEYLDNKFMPWEDMNTQVLNNIDASSLFFDSVMSQDIVRRTEKIARRLSPEKVFLINGGDSTNGAVVFVPGVSDTTANAIVKFNKSQCLPINRNEAIAIPLFPFTFSKNCLFIKGYFNSDHSVMVMLSTKIDDLYINFYYRTRITKMDDNKKKK